MITDPFVIKQEDKEIKDRKLKIPYPYHQKGDYWGTEEMEPKNLFSFIESRRISNFIFILFLVFFFILIRIFHLQVVGGEEYRKIAEGNRLRIERIKASRGIIFDRFGKPLLQNIPKFSLNITPGDLPKDKQVKEEMIQRLLATIDPNQVKKIRETIDNLDFQSFQPQSVWRGIDYQQSLLLKIKLADLPGVNLEIEGQRQYLGNAALSHLLGYLGKINKEELSKMPGYLLNDYLGRAGLEMLYEKYLKGIDGAKRIEVNPLGKEERVVGQQSPRVGSHLILSLDLELQQKLRQALEKQIRLNGGRAGVGIALDPGSGEVLAMVSLPTFDNNKFIQGLSQKEYQELENDSHQPLFFRAIAGTYPTGSAIKPIIAAAGLQEGLINSQTTILSTGGIKIGGWFFPDWKEGGHGITNLVKALAESVNTFFYCLGGGCSQLNGLGIEKIISYLKLFGLGQKTGIDLPDEKAGIVPSPDWKETTKGEEWYIGDTYHLAIGQGDILVTPLQVANYTAAIANGGKLFQPKIVKEILTDGQEKIIEPTILRSNFIKPEYLNLVKQGLRAAVTQGSARRLINLSQPVAGKTGTAQLDKGRPHAWFTGFAPFDQPKIVLTILIENGGEGSVAAVPAAEEVFRWYFENR